MSTTVGTYARETLDAVTVGQRNNRLYGLIAANGHWATSDDAGSTWTDTGVSPASNQPADNIIELVFTDTDMIAVTSDGTLYRNAIDDFTDWTDITVPGLPAGTTGRPGVLCWNGSALFYGNYNASTPGEGHIYRSEDDGANWTAVLDVASARHVHTVNAIDGVVYVTMGDAGSAGKGLYRSTDNGDTWDLLGSNRYGIDCIFARGYGTVPDRLLMEGDGSGQPHVMFHWESLAGAPNTVHGAVWPVSGWSGTARGIQFTVNGDVFWISTAEGGAVGAKDGLWIARAPLYIEEVLLEDITGVTWSYLRTYRVGHYLINANYRMTPLAFV